MSVAAAVNAAISPSMPGCYGVVPVGAPGNDQASREETWCFLDHFCSHPCVAQVSVPLLPDEQRTATITCVTTLEVNTQHGLAKAHLQSAAEPRAALALGHGAAGGVASPDLVAVTAVAHAEGVSVALVEQPYKVAGRRSPAPARQLDVAWTAVVDHLLEGELRGLPLLVGGRSLGARVACRTAEATGAVAVLCLAFPLHAPGRSGAARPSRLHELDEVMVPTLVVQGERDPFGMPPASERRIVVQVPGDHGLKTDLDAVAAAVRGWLPGVLAPLAAERRTG
jgi:uncharacterized protein